MTKKPHKFHSLLHSADILEKRLATLLTPVGITPRQARILNMLSRVGEVSQTVLTEQFDVTSGSMSTMIDRLLKLGMIQRRKNPEDLRGDLISITDQGMAVLQEVRDVWQDIDELIEEKLGPEKAALLTELTRELKFALGGRVPGKDLKLPANQTTKRRRTHET
ncbi:MarR family winged helix-turn-helix transcriptional regulator [Cognatiyoonia sp. IB215446]|uniref:MarR family winged helix-turn-helix transcriptional regulator n=1 Tax=Cognatiyoonia sp. IB215446 TaxID=3097355 RepID=UPI002A118464|nr:MarR family winged helix-turn-helix transcriptional regulator [Cognatiyoonia sp. IB215446]MDX8347967.1 MarR family winged helix-turn-helix transcriptional regulator [Cognatiyoonia sp. IB215446]